MTESFDTTLSAWAVDGVPVYILVGAALAVLGWLLPKAFFRLTGIGRRAVVRTLLLGAAVLVIVGAVASVLLYLQSGVQLTAAWDSDPWGGLAYFAVTGAQLAVGGLCLMALRTMILTARGVHRTLR
ncbi:hypothetical protein [Oceaniglobus indicus]|uniref:hypothetical protein n=1 Tax=Oceaniglobus indicus TaxID=2047749 RepID=UPI000C175F7B|nr:hypothetical protein [Oceaniglobus indicus]